jgi:hypothetical protein
MYTVVPQAGSIHRLCGAILMMMRRHTVLVKDMVMHTSWECMFSFQNMESSLARVTEGISIVGRYQGNGIGSLCGA